MRLSDWQGATQFLQQNLKAIDKNKNGKITRGEANAFLKKHGVDPSATFQDSATMSERLGFLLGYTENKGVDLAAAETKLESTIASAKAVVPHLDPDELGEFSIEEAKNEAGGFDVPFFSLEAMTLALAPELGPSVAGQAMVQTARPALEAAREVLATLKSEISSLESQNAQKASQVNALVSQIESRKAELKQEYENKRTIGIFGALFGVPALGWASLIGMMNDDSKLKTLNTQLAQAQSDRSAIQQKIAGYQSLKAGVEGKIAALEAGPLPEVAATPAGMPKKAAAALAATEQLARSTALLDRLSQERTLLLSVRDAALALGVDIDATIARLTDSAAKAQALVDASRKETMSLLKAALSPDPNAAALKLVKAELEKKVIDPLLKGAPTALKPELKKRFSAALFGGFELA